MSTHENLKKIFELGRCIEKDSSNPYIHTAYKLGLDNYRLISSGELVVRGLGLEIPSYMYEFLRYHNEAIMIANVISGVVISIVLRSIDTKKEFMKLGVSKNMFYGLGKMNPNFVYGEPIVLVEGHLDRDVFSEIYPNVLAITTNKLSKNQATILKSLTNNFVLLLDNDEAGESGTKDTFYKLKGNRMSNFTRHLKESGVKDCGDLVRLSRENPSEYDWVTGLIKSKIKLLEVYR